MHKVYLFIIIVCFLISCKDQQDNLSAPVIENLTLPQQVAPLSSVGFGFKARADAGLQSITIKHLLQNAAFSKTTDFYSTTMDEVSFSHPTGFESVGKQLEYEITVTDKLNRSRTQTFFLQVDPSQVELQVTAGQGEVHAVKRGQKTQLEITISSTSSLGRLWVYSVLKNGEKLPLFYQDNLQLMSKELVIQHYSKRLEIAPDEQVVACQVIVEDNANVQKETTIVVE
ncbi:hypothetical protein Q0590_06035 [Rhodocytophaga aerolata]|uniref:Uncharacterized protein n=1 Tax=Rhodocytophaga aerolata TaxID=455078 RepID=A0ABT8R134_9BACT|nr:hypothetical protein [Rhodocytophaga aerolata]MDO1445800.1 hypothetical protein [Rhodocytophaga aerolata]